MNLSFFVLFFLMPSFTIPQSDVNKSFNTKQLIVVTTGGWNKINGKMNVYEWKSNKWVSILKDIPIVTGRSGLAWGKGLHNSNLHKGKLKKEGDGNAPAGIFYLSGLFGYDKISSKMNSLKVDNKTFCVDDSRSVYYNKIVKTDTARKDWRSAETMRMKSDVYKYGIFVDYNVNPAEAGKGSCIFMHIWKGESNPTAGCTAMTEPNILKLIDFLDKKKNPVLVQVPQSEYEKLKLLYKLP